MVSYSVSSRTSKQQEYEVDYDKNITDLYEAITNSDWEVAIKALENRPREARTWVVRHYEDSDDIMWRFLPLHSACARQPPANVLSTLLTAYSEAARCVDDQGMYPLHYACGNQASREVIRLLLVANPQAAKIADPRGMLPIHYLACWGPSSVSIIDMVLVANRDVKTATDSDGNTALDLAKEGEYAEKEAVIDALERWFEEKPNERELSTPRGFSNPPQLTSADSCSSGSASYSKETDKWTVSRLRSEVSKLRTEQREREQTWEAKMDESVEKLKTQCYNLERKANKEHDELRMANDRLEILEAANNEKEAELKTREEVIAEKDHTIKELSRNIKHLEREYSDKILELHTERDDIRLALREVSENCETFKSRYDHMNDRIGSLSASLSSMMEQQSTLVKTIQEREMREAENGAIRRNKLKGLLDMEERMVANIKQDSGEVTTAFANQAKEMDAIAAVIAAIRK
mmetsp:Transcript_15346/g.22652  ORF Transcript_15346/g.22652 Transcript_15346/m.22652 type:complete len:464 (+) Transcript_15346:51-1442(+)